MYIHRSPISVWTWTCLLQIKAESSRHIQSSAATIVEEAMQDAGQRPNLPKPTNLVRTANRQRQRMRPSEPKDLHFEIDHDFLGSEQFVVFDLHLGRERHIAFATEQQLAVLKTARRWFMDGTFKVKMQTIF